jgi:hypothetical protein
MVGKIVAGSDAGWYVRVDDDSTNTGGYLILIWRNTDEQEGFADWVVTWDDLERIIRHRSWEVEWLDPDAQALQ